MTQPVSYPANIAAAAETSDCIAVGFSASSATQQSIKSKQIKAANVKRSVSQFLSRYDNIKQKRLYTGMVAQKQTLLIHQNCTWEFSDLKRAANRPIGFSLFKMKNSTLYA